MNIDDAIIRLKGLHPLTKEDEEVLKCAIGAMEFARDFIPLGATTHRIKHALNLMNSLEYVFNNAKR